MGKKYLPFYGNADVGSAIEDIEKIVAKIKTNEFGKEDVLKLFKANAELITAILDNDYED